MQLKHILQPKSRMSVFEGLDQKKRYRLSSKISGAPLFDFFVRSTAPLEIKILSGNDEEKGVLIDKMSPFIPSRFEVVETGEAPSVGSLKTAGYRTETAAERIDHMIRMKQESERLKAMAPANESESVVSGPEASASADEISNAVFWGVVAYPHSLRKIILDGIYRAFFLEQHTIKRNNVANFNSKFESRKAILIRKLRQRGIDPSKIDFSAPWSDFKNYDKIANRYSEARAEFSSGGAAAAPPQENELSSGSSIENLRYGGTRRYRRRTSNGRRRSRPRKTRRRR